MFLCSSHSCIGSSPSKIQSIFFFVVFSQPISSPLVLIAYHPVPLSFQRRGKCEAPIGNPAHITSLKPLPGTSNWMSTPLPRSQVLCKNFKVKVLVTQLCLTLCDPMDYSLPASTVHGILQARILQWVAIPFSRGSSQPRGRTGVSCIAGRFFTIWATREADRNVNYVLFRKVVFVFLLLEALNSMKFRDHFFLSIPSVCGIIIAHEWLN